MEKLKQIAEESLYKVLVFFLGLIFLLGGLLFWQKSQPETTEEAPGEDIYEELLAEEQAEAKPEADEANLEAAVPQEIIVDVKGAVMAPGVYTLSTHHRVIDAVEKAGGFNQEAEQKAVNLAKVLEDQMVIYIPKAGEEGVQLSPLNEAAVNSAEPAESGGGLVNINQAEKEVLMTLKGIGNSKADSILSYREENGSFQTIEDIKNVSGIGEATFENLKDSITVSP